MVTSIARQSVILKCNMQKAVMLGNYEFYYGAGVAGKIGGFEIPDDIKPLELRELLDKKLDQISPKDEKETYLIHILKEFRPTRRKICTRITQVSAHIKDIFSMSLS